MGEALWKPVKNEPRFVHSEHNQQKQDIEKMSEKHVNAEDDVKQLYREAEETNVPASYTSKANPDQHIAVLAEERHGQTTHQGSIVSLAMQRGPNTNLSPQVPLVKDGCEVSHPNQDEGNMQECWLSGKGTSQTSTYDPHINEFRPKMDTGIAHRTGHIDLEGTAETPQCDLPARGKTTSAHRVDSPQQDVDFMCTDCEKNFSNQRNLYYHHRKQHKDPTDCSLCTKNFSSKVKYDDHMKKVHGSIPRYLCHKCGLNFSRSDNLQRHCQHSQSCGLSP